MQCLGAVGDAGLATINPVDELAEDKPRAIMAAAVPVLAGWAGDRQHLLFCVFCSGWRSTTFDEVS